MAIASISDLLDALRRTPLLEPEQAAELGRQPAGRFADPRALAGDMMRRGWLTPYQINQLFQGRGGQLVLGSYVLLERLGEGGMGQVFKARQRKLGRVVALKVIRKERLTSPDIVRRFRREIEAAAQLSHPNIVLALDADEHEGTHFFAMEYVEGTDLAKYVKQDGPLPVARACDCVRQAALGLQHAFERGLVHRDIKPHNLLLVAQTGAVKVLDMGLARLLVEPGEEMSATSLTHEGAVMGTPDYIAPEQAMDARSADIRADLYSLGCTFFFLLTGRVPFPGGSLMEKLHRHQNQPTPSVLTLRPDVPPPVAAVVQRLMAKRPADRYQTPAELVVALAAATAPGAVVAAMAAVPVSAPPAVPADSGDTFADLRPDTVPTDDPARRRRQAAERKRLLILSAAGIAALLVVGLLLVLLFKGGAKDRPIADVSQTNRTEEGSPEAAEKEWSALRTRGEAAGADRIQLREDLVGFRRTHPGTRAAGEAAEWLSRLPSLLDALTAMALSPEQKLDGQPKELLAVLGDHRSWVGLGAGRAFVQHSSDGRWLACSNGDGTIRLLNPNDLALRAVLKAEEPQAALEFRPDGKVLATCGYNNIILWDVSGDQPRQLRLLKGFPARLGTAAFSPDGKRLAVPCATDPPTTRLWDVSGEPKEVAALEGHVSNSSLCKPAFSPDGKTLVTGSTDKTIHVWDLSGEHAKKRAVLTDHTYWVVSLTFSPDGKLLASSGQHDYTLRLWDMTLAQPKELTGSPWLGEATNDAAFSPDGKRVACGFWGDHWVLWDVSERRLKQIASVPDHRGLVWGVSFAPDGRTLATGGNDGTVHLWDVTQSPPQQRRLGPGHAQRVMQLAFTPDDHTLISMGFDGTVNLWDLKQTPPRVRAAFPLQPGEVFGALHPDGRTLVTGDSRDKRIFWDVETGKELRSVPVRMWDAAYQPDGKVLVALEQGFTVGFRDVETGEALRTEPLKEGVVMRSVAISPDGLRIAVSDVQGTVHLWHARKRQEHRRCVAPEKCADVLAFSPDGKVLAAAGKDGRLRLFDAANGQERSSLPGHEKDVTFVTFTPDGKQLLSAGLDGRVFVRESATGRELQSSKVPLPIHSAALASDGRHLAVGHTDGTIYLLRLAASPR